MLVDVTRVVRCTAFKVLELRLAAEAGLLIGRHLCSDCMDDSLIHSIQVYTLVRLTERPLLLPDR